MNLSYTLIVIWLAVWLLLLTSTVIFLVLRCKEKSAVPTKKGTVLIWLATISLVYTFTLNNLLDHVDTLREIRTPEFRGRRDLRMEKAESIVRQFELKDKIDGLGKKYKADTQTNDPDTQVKPYPAGLDADNYFKNLNEAEKLSTSLAVRKVIFDQWRSFDTKSYIEKIFATQKLPGFYLPEQENDLKILKALAVANLNDEELANLSSEKRKEVEENLSTKLSEGWYRNTALKHWYTKTNQPEKLSQMEAKYDKYLDEFGWRGIVFLIAGVIIVCFSVVAAIAATIYFWKKPLSQDNNAMSAGSLRSFYCSLLACIWIMILVMSATSYALLPLQPHIPTPIMPTLSILLITLALLLQDVVGVLCLRHYLTKPMALSIRAALARPALINVPGSIFWGCSTFAILIIPSGLISLLFQWLAKHPPQSSSPVSLYIYQAADCQSFFPILLLTLGIAVIGPTAEEILFRGALYSILKRKMGIVSAAIVSGLIFGLIHRDLQVLPQLAVMGFAFAILYERTGRLSACIIAHGLNNLISVLATLLIR